MNERDRVMQPVIDDLNRMPEEHTERLSEALRGRRVLIGQSGGDALAGSLGNAPRGSRPSKRRQRGVFEKVPGSDIWWIRYSDATGRIRREKAGTKGAATQLYHKRKTEVLAGRKLPETLRRREVSFRELVQDALAYSQAHKRSFEDDVYRMKRLLAWFGEHHADSVMPQEIERKLARAAQEEQLAPATLNRYKALISLVYRLGMESGKVSTNPARLVRRRRENNERVRFLSPEEEKRLRDVIERQYAAHLPEFELALNTGLRQGEQYGLRWEDVSFERRVLTVRQSKNGRPRYVSLNSDALRALAALNSRSAGEGRVFDSLRPRHWFEPAVREAGLEDFHWHDLRHTFASRLTMAGVGLCTVQELLGHRSIQMTCRYSHLAPTHTLAAVERLSQFRADAQEARTDTKTSTSQIGVAGPAPALCPISHTVLRC